MQKESTLYSGEVTQLSFIYSRNRDLLTGKVVPVSQHIVIVSHFIYHVAQVFIFSFSHNTVYASMLRRNMVVII